MCDEDTCNLDLSAANASSRPYDTSLQKKIFNDPKIADFGQFWPVFRIFFVMHCSIRRPGTNDANMI